MQQMLDNCTGAAIYFKIKYAIPNDCRSEIYERTQRPRRLHEISKVTLLKEG